MVGDLIRLEIASDVSRHSVLALDPDTVHAVTDLEQVIVGLNRIYHRVSLWWSWISLGETPYAPWGSAHTHSL